MERCCDRREIVLESYILMHHPELHVPNCDNGRPTWVFQSNMQTRLLAVFTHAVVLTYVVFYLYVVTIK